MAASLETSASSSNFILTFPTGSLGRIQGLRAAQRSSRGGNDGFRGSFAVEFQQLPELRQEWTNNVFGALAKYKSGGIMALTSALA